MAHSTSKTHQLVLPLTAVTAVDIGRLKRELEAVNEALLQIKLRKTHHAPKLPATSRLMDELTELNELNLLRDNDREKLNEFLANLQADSPVIHISFGADPSPAFIERLVDWLRREIHPQLLVNIGLQPTIGAGCIVRTTNKQFDLSLRQGLADKRPLLMDKLRVPAAEPVK